MKQINTIKPRLSVLSTSIALAISGLGMPLISHSENNITDALTNGKANTDIRLRYESVEQDNSENNASANTVRTRLGYTTGKYKNLTAFIEMENVTALGEEKYNSKINGKTGYSVIADPKGTEMNQANITYTGLSNTAIRWGQQRVILDNARFVGNVGWRQNEQTLDAFAIINNSIPDTTTTYAYVYNVNGITGGDTNVEAHILNIAYTGLETGKLSAYGYFLDFVDAPTTSQQTLGLRFTGSSKTGNDTKLIYTAEYATQSDYQDGASTIDASYLLGELGMTAAGITAKLGYEVLSGDGSYGFSTPLATKHAFNGWTDMFLTTPADGLTDTYLSVSGKISDTKLMLIYHDFSSDTGNADYGSELGFLVAKKYGKNYSAVLKYASYSAGDINVDTDKLWLQGQLKF